MLRYIIRRLLLLVPTLFGVAVITFVIMRVVPGDIVTLRLLGQGGGGVSPEVIAAERARLGLDQPLWRQFVDWLAGAAQLDFGLSMWTGRPIAEEIAPRLELTIQLALMASIIAVLLAIPLGVLAAVKRGTWIDHAIGVFSIAGLAMPSFWLGIAILLFLVSTFRWTPPVAFSSLWRDPSEHLALLI